jgi:hypothetical protein
MMTINGSLIFFYLRLVLSLRVIKTIQKYMFCADC